MPHTQLADRAMSGVPREHVGRPCRRHRLNMPDGSKQCLEQEADWGEEWRAVGMVTAVYGRLCARAHDLPSK
jgi:hypothetical protein